MSYNLLSLHMATKQQFIVKETIVELKKRKYKIDKLSVEKRLVWLLQFTQGESSKLSRKETAKKANISLRTQERWIDIYLKKGIDIFLAKPTRKKPSKIITKEIHKALEVRLTTSELHFLGYWDATDWVNQKFGVQIKYHWLRKYLIKHFKTKLKSPRKSHYKKDEQAIEAFLKTSNHT